VREYRGSASLTLPFSFTARYGICPDSD